MKTKQIFLVCSLLSMVAFANPWRMNLNFNTSGSITFQDTKICDFRPNYFQPGWTGGELTKLRRRNVRGDTCVED